jgi:hypothetical protein
MPEALALEEHKLPSEQKTTETASTSTTTSAAHQ